MLSDLKKNTNFLVVGVHPWNFVFFHMYILYIHPWNLFSILLICIHDLKNIDYFSPSDSLQPTLRFRVAQGLTSATQHLGRLEHKNRAASEALREAPNEISGLARQEWWNKQTWILHPRKTNMASWKTIQFSIGNWRYILVKNQTWGLKLGSL